MKMATTTVERLLAGVVSLIMAATILEEFTGHIRGVSQASVINSKPRPIRIPVNPAGPQSLHDIQYAHHISARVHHRRGSSPRAEKALSLVPNEDKLFIENIPIDSYSAKGPKRLLSRPPSTNFLRPGLKDLSLKASSEYPNFFRNSSAPDRGKFGRLYSKGISQRKSERQQLLLTGGKHQRDRVYVRPMRRKRRRRSKRMAGFDQEDTRIPPEYGLVVHVQNVESGSNSSIDSTISRLKSALATELSWVPQFIHVKSINFAGSRIEFYFENADGQLVTANRFLSEDLQDRLSGHVPDLGLSQVSPDREITSRHHEP
ncbi:uncharacterized protein LOC101853484, partial [Aplysia californica]|uniref:Uncharacterized protein LOC101853484 n=1 Tax=Aplysia californica TaxID=6500 RepID=A0ABM0K0J8_APLCA